MSQRPEEIVIDQEQLNIINELLTPRAASLGADISKAIRVLKNRIKYLAVEKRKEAESLNSILLLNDLQKLTVEIILFQNPYIIASKILPDIPVNSFLGKLQIWTSDLNLYHNMISGKVSGASFTGEESYLYSEAIRNRLLRAKDDIKKLLSNFLSIEELLTKIEQDNVEEKLQVEDVPSQLESPIMTDIVDNLLITKRGRKLA